MKTMNETSATPEGPASPSGDASVSAESERSDLESVAALFAQIDLRSPVAELESLYRKRLRLLGGEGDRAQRERLERAYALASDRLARAERGDRVATALPCNEIGAESDNAADGENGGGAASAERS